MNIYQVHADSHAAFEDRESDFCIEHLGTAAEVLGAATRQLESLAKAYNDGMEASWDDCKRSLRILNSAKALIRQINGDEIKLPNF
jgi:hypothetical protein